MDITKDIQSTTSFRNNSAEVMQHLKGTGRAGVVSGTGKAAAVVQDAEAYQRLLDIVAAASAEEGIRQGREDLANGHARPAEDVFGEIRAAYGIPR
jgi:PHD/YefM family antitoxin component YafN of YafNO toxin-antitoxin module